MTFRIPFTFSDLDKLKRRAVHFKILTFLGKKKENIWEVTLRNSDIDLSSDEYLRIVSKSLISSFIVIFILLSTVLYSLGISLAILKALGLTILISGFLTFTQLAYPKIYNNKRIKDIERNLIPALQDMLVQLNSGIPLFNILVNISKESYGQLSKEFSKAVKKINAGLPQIEVIEDLGKKNSSVFLKRTLWQLSNGMRAGSDIAVVIEESIKSLEEEQIIQIQTYGNKLNPLIMFYMLLSVIIPALSITFLTIISSMVGLSSIITTILFISLFIFVIIAQIIFLGLIKSIRPSLL